MCATKPPTTWSSPITQKAMGFQDFPAPVLYSRALDPLAKVIYVEMRRLRMKMLPALDSPTEFQSFDFKEVVKRVNAPKDAVEDRLRKLFSPFNLVDVNEECTQFAMYGVTKPMTYMQATLLWPSDWLDSSVIGWILANLPTAGMPMSAWARWYQNGAVDPWAYLQKL